MSRFAFLVCALSLFVACSSSTSNDMIAPIGDTGTDSGKSCTEGGGTHASGSSWTCSDGCNQCSCVDGEVASTTKACGCSDSTGFHSTGTSWKCPDGCNTCMCQKDLTISQTLIACDAGPTDSGSDAGSDAGGSDSASD